MSKSILESYYQKSIHHSQSLALLSLEPHTVLELALVFCLFVCVNMAMLGLCCTMWDLAPCVLCLVAQSCTTPCNPMDCSPPGSSVHGDSPVINTGVCCHALFQGVFPTQESNPGLLLCRRILHWLSHQGSPLAPWPGIKPSPLQWKHRILGTGRLGKSLQLLLMCIHTCRLRYLLQSSPLVLYLLFRCLLK